MDTLNDKNKYNTFQPFQKALQPKRNASYVKDQQEVYTRRAQETNRHIQAKRIEQKHNYENHTHERYTD